MSLLLALYRGGWLRTVDHALGESLRRLRPDTPDLVLAAAALCSRAIAQGHSQLPLALVPELLLDIGAERALPELPPHDEWLAVLHGSPWVSLAVAGVCASPVTPLVLEDEALSLRRYWRYEVRLAEAIAQRLTTTATPVAAAVDARLAQLFPEDVAGAQARTARALLGEHFLLLTGGPGTGKTTTVARALVVFAENFPGAAPTIALAAPTGKAAARLAESVRESLARLVAEGRVSEDAARQLAPEARTLHRQLGWRPDSTDFRHDAAHPLPADLVIVDEASMIDLPLMCKLVEAVAPTATLLLIGDRDQLPSVETGDVLAALCDASEIADLPPARRPTRVHLTQTHRQRADVDVATLAARVRDGEVEAVMSGLANDAFRGVGWRNGSDRAVADAVLAAAVPAFRRVADAPDVASALAEARQFRVLTAVREGAAGSQTLNGQIAAALDPARRGSGFFHGRLVLITENSYRHGLFNGDIGIAWQEHDDASGEPSLRVWFDADGGPRAWLPAALPAHESAFALTVHKSQGSEFERVFLALPERSARVLSRELLYTGLTRCREHVTLWASEPALREGLQRRAQRWSGLAARLR